MILCAGNGAFFTRSMPKTAVPEVEEKKGKKEITLLASVSYGDWRVRSNNQTIGEPEKKRKRYMIKKPASQQGKQHCEEMVTEKNALL